MKEFDSQIQQSGGFYVYLFTRQIVELDGSLEIARQEMLRLRSRSDEEENRFRHREQELLVRLEDSRGRERKLEDQKHNLEVCLADATQQIQELKVTESPFGIGR